jgi:hypothetical protein
MTGKSQAKQAKEQVEKKSRPDPTFKDIIGKVAPA